MDDFSDFMDDLAEFMRDTLTLELLTPGPLNPATLTPSGPGSVTQVISQLCSDQDYTLRQRSQMIVNGVAGEQVMSRAYTAWFPWPTVPDGAQLIIRVNGKARPLLKQGPATDLAGQCGVYILDLGPPELGR